VEGGAESGAASWSRGPRKRASYPSRMDCGEARMPEPPAQRV
jgi:hypothetical protein